MEKPTNYIGLIPARGGSKSIPKKSISLCAGRPLISYTIDAAAQSGVFSRLIVSTDDTEIAETAGKLGAEIPFLRPAEFAGDEAPMIGVIRHAVAFLEQDGPAVSALVLLQPTSPLRTAEHIREAVRIFESENAETLVSVTQVPHQFTPESIMEMNGNVLSPYLSGQPMVLRRQDKRRYFARNGPAILIVKRSVIARGDLYGNPTIGYPMGADVSIDVDDRDDLERAEWLILKRRDRVGGP